MAEDTNLSLDEFAPDEADASAPAPQVFEEKAATDLATVFDVPVSISAVLGRASLSVASLLQLGQGSVLTVSSYPNRTSVVQRGKWVLENILGTPPPPPPPDVPQLKPQASDGHKLTMREAMEEHRKNPACAGCHKLMDPIGLSLENFDAIGRWREADGGSTIDPSGTLWDGTDVKGPAGLRQAILSRPEQFARTTTEMLLTYALGRGLEYYDMPVVRAIVKDAGRRDYRFSSLVTGIVTSVPFQMRRIQE